MQDRSGINSVDLKLSWKYQYECMFFLFGFGFWPYDQDKIHFLALFTEKALEMLTY